MLTGSNIAIIGGDARQLEVIRKLSKLDATIHLVGFDQLDHGFTGANKLDLEELPTKDLDGIILPVSGTGFNGEVETIFSNKKIILSKDILSKTKENCTVYTGISNSYLNQTIQETNRKIVKLFERDDVAIYNSIPTAEGTIMMVIQHTDITIHSSNVMVLGLGRVGMSVARSFANLSANVKVGARKPEHIARISEMGLKAFHLENIKEEVKDIDVCINTIPAPIISSNVISAMPAHTLIVDLASKPGGTDFKYAEKRGIKAILAPGLPGIVAPKTAGQIIANVMTQLLLDKSD
jgi:dipicolinate synthase subunit A